MITMDDHPSQTKVAFEAIEVTMSKLNTRPDRQATSSLVLQHRAEPSTAAQNKRQNKEGRVT